MWSGICMHDMNEELGRHRGREGKTEFKLMFIVWG